MSLVTPFYSSHIVSDVSNDDQEQNGGQITFVLRSQSSRDPAVDGLSPEHMTHRMPDVTAAKADQGELEGGQSRLWHKIEALDLEREEQRAEHS